MSTGKNGGAFETKQESPMMPMLYPQLGRSNYTIWVMKMSVVLQAQEVWEDVDPGGKQYEKGGAEYRKDRLARSAIYQAVPDQVMTTLAGKATAKVAWDAIKILYQGHDRVREANLQTLQKSFESLQMHNGESIEDFAGKVSGVMSGMRSLREKVPEIAVVRSFLRAAPARYMQLMTSIEQCVNLTTLTVEDLVGRYKAYDKRMQIAFGDPEEREHLMLTRS